MLDESNILLVFVTAANPEEAAKISESAVGSHQAACATTIQNVHSLYWWEGKLMKDQESIVLLKTTTDRFEALQETIKAMHSYEVPEIIAVPVVKGLPQYLAWVEAETTRYSGS
jgi:periplasmic divalent cation tolerance protein